MMSAVPGDDSPPGTTPPARSTGTGPLALGVAVAVVLTGAATALVLPDLLGLDRRTPFVQSVSLRPYALVVLVGLLAVLGAFARRHRWLRAPVAGLAAVALAGAVMVLPRAVPTPGAAAGGAGLTVIALNTLGGRADVRAVAELVRTERPDLVALVEVGWPYRARVGPVLEPLGYRLHTETGDSGGDVSSVTVAAAEHLGDLTVTAHTASPFPSVELTGGALGPLRFVAYHSVAPRRGDVGQWRSDLAALPRWCAGADPAIVAGDFNATLDHADFRAATAGCRDVAAQLGHGLVPTWPTWLPDWIGPQIDHVIATGSIAPEAFAVREIAGSDHRAVIARLRVPPR